MDLKRLAGLNTASVEEPEDPMPGDPGPQVDGSGSHLSSLDKAASVYASWSALTGRRVAFKEHGVARVASVSRKGSEISLLIQAADGKQTSIPATAKLAHPLVQRIATLILADFSQHFDAMMKSLIKAHGLPVDENINWDKRLNKLFIKLGVAPKNDELREDAIQETIFRYFTGDRDMLASFDPDRLPSEIPLAEKVSIYIQKVFAWRAERMRDYVDQYQDHLSLDKNLSEDNDSTLGDLIPGSDAQPDESLLDQEAITDLASFRTGFAAYLKKHREGDLPDTLMILFDILVGSHDGAEAKKKWEATGKSYTYMRNLMGVLQEELVHFAKSANAPQGLLTKLINDLRTDIAEAKATADKAPAAEPVEASMTTLAAMEDVPDAQTGALDSATTSPTSANDPITPKEASMAIKKSPLSKPKAASKPAAPAAKPAPKAAAAQAPLTAKTASKTGAALAVKFATLKKLAEEHPEEVADAIAGIRDIAQGVADNAANILDNLNLADQEVGMDAPVEEGAEEGETVLAKKAAAKRSHRLRYAKLRRTADAAPEAMEAAIGDLYMGLDDACDAVEALAENLDIELPTDEPEEGEEGEKVEEPVAEEGAEAEVTE